MTDIDFFLLPLPSIGKVIFCLILLYWWHRKFG